MCLPCDLRVSLSLQGFFHRVLPPTYASAQRFRWDESDPHHLFGSMGMMPIDAGPEWVPWAAPSAHISGSMILSSSRTDSLRQHGSNFCALNVALSRARVFRTLFASPLASRCLCFHTLGPQLFFLGVRAGVDARKPLILGFLCLLGRLLQWRHSLMAHGQAPRSISRRATASMWGFEYRQRRSSLGFCRTGEDIFCTITPPRQACCGRVTSQTTHTCVCAASA